MLTFTGNVTFLFQIPNNLGNNMHVELYLMSDWGLCQLESGWVSPPGPEIAEASPPLHSPRYCSSIWWQWWLDISAWDLLSGSVAFQPWIEDLGWWPLVPRLPWALCMGPEVMSGPPNQKTPYGYSCSNNMYLVF